MTTDEGWPEPHMRPGVNSSTWPMLKLARAAAHHDALKNDWMTWVEGYPLTTRSELQPDGQSFHVFLHIVNAPKTYDWSLTLGDTLHSLRSALDALAWEVARFDGRVPKNPKAVQFPVCMLEKDWAAAVKAWVGDIDPVLAKRIESLQPFNWTFPGVHPLDILHRLDIQDKHRSAIELSVGTIALDLRGSFRLLDPDAPISLEPVFHEGPLEEGAHVLTLNVGAAVSPDDHDFTPKPVPQMSVHIADERLELSSRLGQLVLEVRRYVHIVMTGEDLIQAPAPEGSLEPG